MPQVPRLFRQVEERALAGNRVPMEGPGIEAFGGGQQIASAIQGLGNIAEDAYVAASKNQIMQADADLTNVENELLNNPESGALNLSGEDAFKAPEEVDRAYQENLKQIEDKLTTPMAKNAFKRMAMERRSQVQSTLNKHVSREMEVYNKQIAKTFADTKMNFALTNYQNPEIVQGSIQDVFTSIDESPAYRGIPQQTKDMMKLEYASSIHKSIIDRMVDNGEDLAAQKYFESNKSMIAGKDLAVVEKSLEASSLASFAQREGDSILSQTGSYRQAISMANAMTKDDPKKRQALVDNISRQFNLRKQAEREDQEQTSQYIGDLLDKNGGDLNDPRIQRMMTGMTINEKENIKKYANALSSGETIQTDRDYYMNMRELAVSNPNAFKNMNMNSAEAKTKLSRSDWDKLFTIQQDIRKGKESKELKNFRDDKQIADGLLNQMKIKKTDKRATEFNNKFYTALERFRDENGRNPKDTEMQAIGAQLAVQVITEKGFLFDTKKYAFEVQPEEEILEIANPEDKKRLMLSQNKPKVVKQNGVEYRFNEATGRYERK